MTSPSTRTSGTRRPWRYFRILAIPAAVWVLLAVMLDEPLRTWLRGEDQYDEAALREWLDESRVFRDTLPDMVADYLDAVATARRTEPSAGPESHPELLLKVEKIHEHLQSLGTLPTKLYPAQLPLFPLIYRLELRLDDTLALPPVLWDSEVPRNPSQYLTLEHRVHPQARVVLHYQLHAYDKRQRIEQAGALRRRWVTALVIAATFFAFVWLYLAQRREQLRERQRAEVQHQIEETERKLLEQRLATQAAEARALEVSSRFYANIGIMAGSYAHNIKNLLVRPNDLIRRCLEQSGADPEQGERLNEVRQTLGTVTERLQEILRTVRRDPSRVERSQIDLNQTVRELAHTWSDLARDKWKLELRLELDAGALWVMADRSHLQQAVENLLFNARDATFEMRNHRRDQAHKAGQLDPAARRQALIEAAAWRGRVVLRTHRRGDDCVVLEVEDNGIGMEEEVRRRCTETHFSTKRDNALHEGNSTGMGLGLSFVTTILEHHGGELEIASQPLHGATFRVVLPHGAGVTGERGGREIGDVVPG